MTHRGLVWHVNQCMNASYMYNDHQGYDYMVLNHIQDNLKIYHESGGDDPGKLMLNKLINAYYYDQEYIRFIGIGILTFSR